MAKRIFLIVLDSFGIGRAPDAAAFGDEGSDTLAAIASDPAFDCPTLQNLGLFNIDGVKCRPGTEKPQACYARLQEKSRGKDTTIGHWEIAGVESKLPLPVFPNGFPAELIGRFEKAVGRRVICNKPYSGTEVIRDYGEEQLKTGALIVYTSADSVFQIAANEAVVPVEELYRCCETARALLTGPYAVGRVIARPFEGTERENFRRTVRRHDYSLTPPQPTMLDSLQKAGLATIGVGKIHDIFAGQGIGETLRTTGNADGMRVIAEVAQRDFEGLCFVNLVDFDMLYGHRNDVAGYAAAATAFDAWLAGFLPQLRPEDLLLITADHGCDPSTPSTDHSRECVPLLLYGRPLRRGVDLGTLPTYGCIAATVLDYFGVPGRTCGDSLLDAVIK